MNDPGTDHEIREQPPRIGILLINLGTPHAPQKKALRAYLKEFLWDPRVVEIPRPLWWLILHGVILTVRPARSASSYRRIWTERGSPLLVHTQDQADALRTALRRTFGNRVDVEFAMRYGAPSIPEVAQRMLESGVRKLLVLPLYPQYSATTTASGFDALAGFLARQRALPAVRFVNDYHDHPAYISAIAAGVRAFRAEHGNTAETLVFSYHGLPQRFVDQGDPYYRQCLRTSTLVAADLGLAHTQYRVTFQSRFGRAQWLQPYTDATLRELPAQGIDAVQVVSPGFAADCLETLEELAVENREHFLSAGGTSYQYIPCLNSSAEHIDMLARIAGEQLAGWIAPLASELYSTT